MRVLGVAFAVLIAGTMPITAHANGPPPDIGPANVRTAPQIVLVWDGDNPGVRPGAPAGQRTAGQVRQWNGQWVPPHWRRGGYSGAWGPYGGPGVPTYWAYVPGSAVFDYPFSDWRGPTGGWGNP